ncbi:MAG TPA: glycosyltransferase family 39 protein [Candidatus Eisenbacteria bacterium]|jgi:tetratricopeptide (TPR) repeat protein
MKPRPAAKPSRQVSRPRAFSLHGSAEIAAGETRLLTRITIVIAALFAAALLMMVAGPHRIGDYMTETDFYGDYARGARLVQQGRLLPSRYGVVGPGYEIALALAGFVARDLFVAAQLLSVAAMTGALLLWYFLLRRRAGARIALLAALFMATNAHFFHYGYAATTDALALALQAGALYLLFAGAGRRATIGAGLLSAAAFLTRYNAIYLLPAGLIATLAGAAGGEAGAAAGARAPAPGAAGAKPQVAAPGGGAPEPPRAPARRARAALEFAAGFFAPVVPWVLYSLAHGGSISLQLHHNIAYEVFARARGIPWDTYQSDLQPQFKSLMDVIRRDPRAVFGRMLFNVWDHLRLDALTVLGWPTAVAGLLGLALGARDGSLRRLWPLGAAWALLFLTLVPTFHSQRYSIALLPFYAVPPAIAFGSPRFALAFGRARRWLKPALAVVPLLFAVTQSVATQAYVVDQLPIEVLECAATLRQLKQPGDRLIARKWHLAFHAGVEGLPFPFSDSLAALARYAHENRARWLYFSWPEAETRPQFYYLLDTSGVVPGLVPRRATYPHPAVLYEIGPEFGRAPSWLANDTLHAYHLLRAKLMIEGDNAKILLDYAQLLRLRGDLEGAGKAALRAAHFAPRDVKVLTVAASIALQQQDARTALGLLQTAADLAPRDASIRVGLGLAYLRAGAEGEAAAEWRQVIEQASDPEVLLAMAKVFHAAGDRAAEQRAVDRLRRIGGVP